MGKGSYLGGSSVTGFGSYDYKLSKMKPTKAKVIKPRKKAKKVVKAQPVAIPAALAGDDELQRLSKRVKAIETDIKAAQTRMNVLNKQLQLATDHLKAGITAKLPKPPAKARGKQ